MPRRIKVWGVIALAAVGILGFQMMQRAVVVARVVPELAARDATFDSVPASHLAAAPSVAPVPSSALNARGVGMSLADTLSGMSDDALDAELADIASLGITWIRVDFDWSVIQRDGKDSYDWSLIDRTVSSARRHGLTVLPILVYTPAWARASGCSSNRCPPADVQDFARFASVAAKRYPGICQWEVWNEENMAGSWRPAADAGAYVALLAASSRAIKEVSPGSIIITGGLGPIATSDGNMAPVDFIRALYDQKNSQSSFDAVGMHPYSFPALPGDPYDWNAWRHMSAAETSIRSIMVAHDDSMKKIWMTEYGAPTGGPGVAATLADQQLDNHPDHVDEALQSRMIQEAVASARNASWAGPLFIYSYKDLGTDTSTTENFYGIVRADGTAKPAYEALKGAIR